MQRIPDVIPKVCSGIVRLAFFKDSEQVGNGSGFLSNDLLITNSHVMRPGQFDAVEMTFGDQNSSPITPIRYLPEDFYASVLAESPEEDLDYAVLKFQEPEFRGRFQFPLVPAEKVKVGDQVLFFGFPFGTAHLTSHVGFVSAKFRLGQANRLQIDGSINPGNSGGPLVHITSGNAVGIVTRTQTGLERDFDELVKAIEQNVQVLQQSKAIMKIGGIDPVNATQVTMRILLHVAKNLKRSANGGIGYAYDAEHVLQTKLL